MSPFRDPNKKGIALLQKGQYAMAIEEFQRVLTKDPKNWQTYCYLGDVHRMLGNNDEAISYYNDSIYHNPEAIESYEGLAIAYADKGIKFNEAVDLHNKTQQILKDDKFALEATKDSYLESLGWIYYRKGDIAKALEFYDEAYPIWQKGYKIGVDEFDPYFSEVHYHFGMIFLLKKEPEMARVEFEKAIKCSPHSIFSKRSREELDTIAPSLTPAPMREHKSIESYPLDKIRRQRKGNFIGFHWEIFALFAFLAFLIAARFFFSIYSDEIRKYYSYVAGRYSLLFYFIGTFILSIPLFRAFNKMETEKLTSLEGFSQRLHWAGLGLGFIIFICFLLLFIYHLILFIISIIKMI